MRLLARSPAPRLRGSAHALRSAHNHFTLVEPFPNGKLYFKPTVDRPVCVYVIDDKLFVLATELRAFKLTPTGRGRFQLRSLPGGRLFSLGCQEREDVFRPVADRIVADAWENFELRPPPLLDPRQRAIIARLDAAVDRLDDPTFLATVGGGIDAEVIDVCLAAAAPGTERVYADKRFARALAEAFPGDAYAEAFRRLEGGATTETEIALGGLWRDGLDGGAPTLPFLVNCRARQLRQPTRKACVLATLRNEAPYIVEWLAYHRSIGIERFFVYENDSQDGSRELVDRLAGHGLIDVVHNVVAEGGNAQSSAYAHALGLRPEILDYEWCAVVDLDEFLLLNDPSHAAIDDFLATFDSQEADAIAVNWIVYGPNGRLQRDHRRSVMETFTWRQELPDRHIKSIVRPRIFFASSPHYPHRFQARPYALVDPLGRPHVPLEEQKAWSTHADESRVGLAHYVYKSLDEFLLKWSRNRGDNPRRLEATNEVLTKEALEAFVSAFHQRGAPAPASALSAKVAAEARRIRALPGIAAIEREAEQRYMRIIGAIREMFLSCPAVRASKMGPHFRELVRLAATRPEI